MTKVGSDRRRTDVGIELEKRVGIEDGGNTFKFHGLVGRHERNGVNGRSNVWSCVAALDLFRVRGIAAGQKKNTAGKECSS